MTAKEMFEEAGYFYDRCDNYIIIFETWLSGCNELKQNEILRFEFIDKKKWYLKPKRILRFDLKNTIDIKLLKAINKQIEELGWLDGQK